jgi:hypothetical protein
MLRQPKAGERNSGDRELDPAAASPLAAPAHSIPGLPAIERFDRGRAAVGKVYELSAPGYDGAGELQVNASIWNLGSLLLSDKRFGSRFQRRSARSCGASI